MYGSDIVPEPARHKGNGSHLPCWTGSDQRPINVEEQIMDQSQGKQSKLVSFLYLNNDKFV